MSAEPEENVHGDERYVILVGRALAFRRIAETSLEGIGLCLLTLRDEGQISEQDKVGILDRSAGRWLIFPGGLEKA